MDAETIKDCEQCGREGLEADGIWILVFTHRVDGQPVGEDWDWICARCKAERHYMEEK